MAASPLLARPPGPRFSMTRRASLTGLSSLQEEAEVSPLPDPADLDLKALAQRCAQTMQRCTTHEQTIARLTHDIDVRVQRWHNATAALHDIEHKSTHLTEQLQAQLATIKTDTMAALQEGKKTLNSVEDRVAVARKQVVGSTVALHRAVQDMEDLEEKMHAEERTIANTSVVTTFLLYFIAASIALLMCFLLWWNRKSRFTRPSSSDL